jgi:hypothetical protein
MRMLPIQPSTLATIALLAMTLVAGCNPTGQPVPATGSGPASTPDRLRGQAESLKTEDIFLKDRLEADGEAVVGEHLVLFFPRGSLTGGDAERLLGEFQQGIVAAKEKIGRPDWNHLGDRRLYFYLPDDQLISHASDGNCAFIPLWRIKERKAPWLHEALHLLLNSKRGDWRKVGGRTSGPLIPLWLHEGLAEALAIDISLAEGLKHYSPFYDVPADQLDALAARALREAPSPEVLAVIGGGGRMPELFGPDRVKFAVPFYSGSASFVRFIAKRHGYPPLLAAIEDFQRENETLERKTGESLDSMKAAWLEQIGY